MAYDPGYSRRIEEAKNYSVAISRRNAYAKQATPDMAKNLSAITRKHPQLDPKVAAISAFAGISADDPALMELSARSIAKQESGGGGWLNQIGKIVTAPARAVARHTPLDDWAGDALNAVAPAAKAGLRGAMVAFETPFQVGTGLVRNIAAAPGVGQLGEIAAGALSGAAAGFAAGSVVPFFGNIAGAVGGAAIGGAAGAMADPVKGKWQNPLMQSSGGQVMSKMLKGDFDEIDLGSGYFTGGQIHEDLVKRQRKAAAIDGMALTPGRLIADGFAKPGTTRFNLISGLVDMANVMKFDPTLLAGKELKAFRHNKNLILPKAFSEYSPTGRFLAGKKRALGDDIELVDEVVPQVDEIAPAAADPNQGVLFGGDSTDVDLEFAQEYATQQGYPGRSYMNDPRVPYDDLIERMDEVLPPEARQLRDTYVSGEYEGVTQRQSRQALQDLLPYTDDPAYREALNQGLGEVGLPEEFVVFRGSRSSQVATEGVMNVTLDPGTAKSFGNVEAYKVSRGDVVAFGNRGERELIVRAEAAERVGMQRPTPLAPKKIPKDARETQQTRDAGLIFAEADEVDTQAAINYLQTDDLKEAVRFMAGTESASTIRKAFNNKITPQLAVRLKATKTEAEVIDVLTQAITNRELMERTALETGRGIMGTVRTYRKNSRLGQWAEAKTERSRALIPQGGIDLIDLDIAPHKLGRAMDYLDDYMISAGLDDAERTKWLDELAEVSDAAGGDDVLQRMVTTSMSSKLKELRWGDAEIDRVLGGYRLVKQDMREILQEQLSDIQHPLPGMVVEGELVGVAKGNLVSEFNDNIIELPDVREVRRMTTPDLKLDPRRGRMLKKADQLEAQGNIEEARQIRAEWTETKQVGIKPLEMLFGREITASRRQLYNSTLWKGSTRILDHYMGKFWRPATLLRPAWTVRIIMEEQARMAAQGMHTPLAHPLSLITALVTGKGSPYAVKGATGDVLSRSIAHQETMATSTTSSGRYRPALSKHTKVYNKMDDGAGDAWAATLITMNKDQVARMVAEKGVDETLRWFQSADGAAARAQVERVLNKPGVALGGSRAEAHIRSVAKDIDDITAMDPQIRQAIATGRLKGFESRNLKPGVAPEPVEWAEKLVGKGERIMRKDIRRTSLEKIRELEKTLPPGYAITTNTKRTRVNHRYRVIKTIPQSEVVEKAGLTALRPEEQAMLVKKRIKELKKERRLSVVNRGDVNQLDSQIARLENEGYAALLDELDGLPLNRLDGKGIINPDVGRELQRRLRDTGIKTPEEVLGPAEITKQHLSRMDRATDWMFTHLLSMPTDYMSRSPAFAQTYWKRMADIAPGMTREAQQEMLANLAKAGVDKKTMGRVKMSVANGKTGNVVLTDADELAKAYAVDNLKSIFDDMTKKSAYDEAFRHIAPFGNAWRQATTQWLKIFADDPTAIRKLQLGVQAPRGADLDADGQGFFYKDDKGEWMFHYPGSEILTKTLTGVPFKMSASAAGMSMVSSSVLPGFGPMVSIAASRILPNTPQYDDLRQVFAPYGDPSKTGLVAMTTPPWFDKVFQAIQDPEINQLQGSTTADVMRYLVSTGKYDTSTPEGQNELLEAAEQRAKHMTLLRAGYQAFGPSAPRIVPMAQDKNGDTVVAQVLMKEMAELTGKDYNTATEKFLEKYGDNAWMFLQGKTRAANPGVTNLGTDEGLDFARENPELVKLLPNTYGFFAPPAQENEDEPPNFTAYLRLIQTGEREVLTPKEQMNLAMDKVGSMQYFNIKDALGPKVSREQQAALREIKSHLMKKYPGFGTAKIGLDIRAETPELITELENAVQIDKVRENPVGDALNKYLALRRAAQVQAEARGLTSFKSAAAAQDLRDILREAGNLLSKRTPGFHLLFDRVLTEEMED